MRAQHTQRQRKDDRRCSKGTRAALELDAARLRADVRDGVAKRKFYVFGCQVLDQIRDQCTVSFLQAVLRF
jgi:hypothetical protein